MTIMWNLDIPPCSPQAKLTNNAHEKLAQSNHDAKLDVEIHINRTPSLSIDKIYISSHATYSGAIATPRAIIKSTWLTLAVPQE